MKLRRKGRQIHASSQPRHLQLFPFLIHTKQGQNRGIPLLKAEISLIGWILDLDTMVLSVILFFSRAKVAFRATYLVTMCVSVCLCVCLCVCVGCHAADEF